MSDKLPISLIAIVRNAQGRVNQLIDHHKDIVSETIIVDQCSNDGTFEDATEKADLVFRKRPKGTADPDRNWAFSLGNQPYVLYLDDDEYLSKEAIEDLKLAMKTGGDIFWFKRKNLVDGVDIHKILGDDLQCRLFRKGAVKFPEEIHKYPESAVNTTVFYMNSEIIHQRTLDQIKSSNKMREAIASEKAIEMQENFIQEVEALLEGNKGFTEDWYSTEQLKSLKAACERVKSLSGKVVEIGCWEGKSTCTIANTLPDDTIIAVDTWQGNLAEGDKHASVLAAKERDVFSRFKENVGKFTKGNVEPNQIDCFAFLKGNKDKIKFCHIDAAHDYGSVKKTIQMLLPHLVEGAVLCGDDFASANIKRTDLQGGVERAVREMCPGFVSQDNFWYWIKK